MIVPFGGTRWLVWPSHGNHLHRKYFLSHIRKDEKQVVGVGKKTRPQHLCGRLLKHKWKIPFSIEKVAYQTHKMIGEEEKEAEFQGGNAKAKVEEHMQIINLGN